MISLPFDCFVNLSYRKSPLYVRKSLSSSVTTLQKALCKKNTDFLAKNSLFVERSQRTCVNIGQVNNQGGVIDGRQHHIAQIV